MTPEIASDEGDGPFRVLAKVIHLTALCRGLLRRKPAEVNVSIAERFQGSAVGQDVAAKFWAANRGAFVRFGR